jgi:UDP-glucose 4-epimerase
VGPRQTGRYGMVVPRFIESALKNEPLYIFGDGKQSRCFTYIDDAVDALIKLSEEEKAIGEIFNVGSIEEHTIEDVAKKIKILTSSRSKLIKIPYNQAYDIGFEDMIRRVPNIKKISGLIGFSPKYNLENILQKIIDWKKKELNI